MPIKTSRNGRVRRAVPALKHPSRLTGILNLVVVLLIVDFVPALALGLLGWIGVVFTWIVFLLFLFFFLVR
jgi:hypothetical protein